MQLNEKIANWASQALSGEDQFLLEVVVSSKHGPKKVTVIVDGDRGITIDDCAEISRRLIQQLEEEPALSADGFTLEVTTPGVDHPLKLKRQYVKNIGRGLKVVLKDKTVENGKLTAVNEDTITLDQESNEKRKTEVKQTVVPFSEIERAIVNISFK